MSGPPEPLDSFCLHHIGLGAVTTSSPRLSRKASTVIQEDSTADTEPALVIFTGGTAFNSVAGELKKLSQHVSHVIPVSDDGGSTAEIVRVLGGPAVGDIRSRCLRLADNSDTESKAVRALLAHRLPTYDSEAAKREWYSIVEGEHELWRGVSDPYKHTIRAFLVHFHQEILRCSDTQRFVFRNGSVGNFFFAGARIFFRSLEAAIFLFSRVARIPEGSLILPAICTEERITLGAQLSDGSVIRGQHEISHPSADASNLVDKRCDARMAAPIKRIFYLSAEGTHQEHEVALSANRRVTDQLAGCDAIIYAMGSLYTSLCPSLILLGMGESVAGRRCPKVMIMNGALDRETAAALGNPGGPMTAVDFVQAVTDALNRKGTKYELDHPTDAYVTGLIIPSGGEILVAFEQLTEMGVQHVVEVDARQDDGCGQVLYSPASLVEGIASIIALQTGTYVVGPDPPTAAPAAAPTAQPAGDPAG